VKNALPRMRFIPAEVGDKKVRQLVQQPFSFAITK
jgi:protein TonB